MPSLPWLSQHWLLSRRAADRCGEVRIGEHELHELSHEGLLSRIRITGSGQDRAFLGVLQLHTWMVISFLAIISLMSICLFAYYYWQHSRRYYFTNQIKEIIKQGEGAHLEFKSTLRYDLKEKKINKLLEKVVLKSIAAFNNSDGGLLLIGVDDAGKILGLKADYRTLKKPDKDGFELHLRSLISRSYGEHFVLQQIEIYFPCLAKEEVCVLKINKGRKPLYISVADKNGAGKSEKFYIRRGNSSIAMEKPSDIMAYQKDRFSWRGKLLSNPVRISQIRHLWST